MFIFLFIPTGSASSWPCCISGLHQTGDQPPVSLTNSLCSASPCLPERWEEEVACNDSFPLHIPTGPLRKGLSHIAFSLSEEESPYTSTAYVPSEAAQAAFLGCLWFLPKLIHICHQDAALCRGGVCCCMCKGNGKGRQSSDLLLLSMLLCDSQTDMQLYPGQSSLLQQNQGFVFTSAVQTWCKRKQNSLSPALNLSFLPMSLPFKKHS